MLNLRQKITEDVRDSKKRSASSGGDFMDSEPQDTTPIIFCFIVHRATSYTDEENTGFVQIDISLSVPPDKEKIRKQVIEAICKRHPLQDGWQITDFYHFFSGTFQEMERAAEITRRRMYG